MQGEAGDIWLMLFSLLAISTQDRVTLIGAEGKWPRWVYEPRLSALEGDSAHVIAQVGQLNRVRAVSFLPGVRKRFSDIRGHVWIKQNGAIQPALFSSLKPEERDRVLEVTNLRSARFSCAFLSASAGQIDTAPLQPTVTIKSSAGLHAIWRLDQPIEGDEFRHMQNAIATQLGADRFNPHAPFIPLPECDDIRADGTRERVSIVHWDGDNTYSLDEMQRAFAVPSMN